MLIVSTAAATCGPCPDATHVSANVRTPDPSSEPTDAPTQALKPFGIRGAVMPYGTAMTVRLLSSADRPLLREATLANMNWDEPRFTFEDVDDSPEISHYFSSFPSGRDFGLAHESEGVVKAVAWLVFLPADDPGYGFVDAETPELSITTLAAWRGQGIGTTLLSELLNQARSRGIGGISLSVEDGNRARHIYERAGFHVLGRNGGSDTMFISLIRRTPSS